MTRTNIAKFTAELMEGHKLAALEVPFDPAVRWLCSPTRLWRGRHGFLVQGKLNQTPFESCIVPRSKRFFLLVDQTLLSAAGLAVGDLVLVTVAPQTESPK